jgi:hypothetical protein
MPSRLPRSAAAEHILALEARQGTLRTRGGVEQLRRETAAARATLQEEESLALSVFEVLPIELTRFIFELLDLESRLTARCVCRAWRALLEDRSLWADAQSPRSFRLCEAASLRAGHTLRELSLSRIREDVDPQELHSLVARNGATLRHLDLTSGGSWADDVSEVFDCPWDSACLELSVISSLTQAAPALQSVRCKAMFGPEAVFRLFRHELPLLRLTSLWVNSFNVVPDEEDNIDIGLVDVHALASALLDQRSLQALWLEGFTLTNAAELQSLTDAAVAIRLEHMVFAMCAMEREGLACLTTLLERNPALRTLDVTLTRNAIFAGELLPAFCAALRASRLTTLWLSGVSLFQSPEDGAAVLRACTGHPTLRRLYLWGNMTEHQAAFGEALSALVSAPGPLQLLDARSELGAAAIRPLFDALRAPHVTLKRLFLSGGAIEAECARTCVLPSVQANASLRTVSFFYEAEAAGEGRAELLLAQAIVKNRDEAVVVLE